MLIHFFVVFLAGAIASLLLGIKMKKGFLCMIATVLFLVLAFQAFRIELPAGSVTIVFEEVIIVVAAWAGAMISFVCSLFAAVSQIREKLKDKKKQRPGVF